MTVTLEMCTLFKGVPSGLALIQYEDPDDIGDSFKGVGIFNDGILTNTPFTCIIGNGNGLSFSKMENGRPADNSYFTVFNRNGRGQHVHSLEEETDVTGW